MEGMTRVSVESTHAKVLLPGYITVVVVSASAKSSGITEGAHLVIPLPFAKLPSHYGKILVIMSSLSLSHSFTFPCCVSLHLVLSLSLSPNTPKSGQHLTIIGVNIYCGLFES